jgi:SlyX protein
VNTIGKRIDELEIRLSHQQKAIAELNDVISEQWKKIAALERQVLRFGEELQDLEPINTPTNQKPPHY